MFGMNDGYWLYMNEASGSGLVNTRQGRINSLGRELRSRGYAGKVVPSTVFASLLHKYKLEDITQSEIHDIERNWL
jgi:hypothetical protein